MKKYDYSQCNKESLNAFFEAYEGYNDPYFATTSKYPGHREFLALKEQARLKTRAEYDVEIGRIIRQEIDSPFGINYWEWDVFLELVRKSKEAPE